MSRRVSITPNEKKDKDRIIVEFLKTRYSESEAIKEILYQYATNRYSLRQEETKKESRKPQKIDKRPNGEVRIEVDDDIKNMFF